jgi:diguanylate cyclase (GGDEF)-like protein
MVVKNRSVDLYFFLLIVVGLLGNYFNITLFFGVDFTFGTIAAAIILRVYGTMLATFATFVISTYTLLIWGHPFGLIIFTLEIMFIGLISTKYNRNYIIIDTFYWILLGAPLVFLFHQIMLDTVFITTKLLILKHTVNGVLNVVIANILLAYTPINRLILNRNSIPLNQLLTTSLVALIFVPTVLLVSVEGYKHRSKINDEMRETTLSTVSNIKNELKDWYERHLTPLEYFADSTNFSNIKNNHYSIQKELNLLKHSFDHFEVLYVADDKGKTIAFHPSVNNNFQSNIGLDFSDRNYYKQLVKTKKPVISNVVKGRAGINAPVVAITVPIMQGDKFIGYVLGAIRTEKLKGLLLKNVESDSLQVTLVDANKMIVSTTDSNLESMMPYSINNVDIENFKLNLIYPQEEELPHLIKWRESKYLYKGNVDQSFTWSIITEISIKPYQYKLYNYYSEILSIAIVLLFISLFIAYNINKKLLGPLTELQQITSDLPRKLPAISEENWPSSSILEIQFLIANIHSMTKKLNEMFTLQQKTQQHLKHLAHYDELTGLRNRFNFIETIKQVLDDHEKNNKMFAVLYIDLDRFKIINDTMGHSVGDRILKEASKRMMAKTNDSIKFFRQGGDEFLALYENMNSVKKLSHFCNEIIDEISKPFEVNQNEFYITTSIGVCIYPEHAKDQDTLLQYADMALYTAKESGKNNFKFFNVTMHDEIIRKHELEKELRKAIEKEQLYVVYQPQINLKSGNMCGVEALVRWRHPLFGDVSPAEFIPIAEENGLIYSIGEWVLRTVCEKVPRFKRVPISINVSVGQLMEEKFEGKVLSIIKESSIPPEYICLEITESTAVEHLDLIANKLRNFRKRGIKIAIDDFGTGYTSLNYLKHIPMDYMKIDKSFIDDMLKSEADDQIVESIIKVAHSYNYTIVAEGVETEAQLANLLNKNCDIIQGYLFSKPVELEVLGENIEMIEESSQKLINRSMKE